MIVTEHRREPRVEMDEVVFVQLLNPFSEERLAARVVNRSTGGVCIASLTFLPRGGEVQVFHRGDQLFGKIRYCVPAKEGFRSGIAVSQIIATHHD